MVVQTEQTQDPDLVLRLRLESLRKNLNQISQAETAILRLHAHVEYLRNSATELGSGIEFRLGDLMGYLEHARGRIAAISEAADLPPSTFKTPLDALANARDAAEAINERFARMKERIEVIWEPLEQLTPAELSEPLESSLVHESQRGEATIARLEKELARIRKGKQASSDRAEIWQRYERLAYQEGDPLFGEYVDLLGGLALRNTGIDSGICAMADALIRRLHYVAGRDRLYHSVAVPARRGARERTMARIIRLGFPEWTVWAVPLAAHEFGHVVVADHGELGKRMRRSDITLARAEVSSYLADAFATYVMGPAYACAAVLLRLDPCHEDNPPDRTRNTAYDRRRAHVLLRMLDLTDEDGAFAGVRNFLAIAWENALSAFPPDRDDALAADELDKCAELMEEFLSVHAHKLRYPPARFMEVKEWPGLTEHAPKDFPFDSATDGVRDILNAAWLERTRLKASAANTSDELAKAAWSLWDEQLRGGRKRSSSFRPDTMPGM